MFVTGPEVVKAVTGEEVSFYDLGGSEVHGNITGISHLVGDTEEETIDLAKKLISYLPQNNLDDPPVMLDKIVENNQADLSAIIPLEENEPYDMKRIIKIIADSDSFFELQE